MKETPAKIAATVRWSALSSAEQEALLRRPFAGVEQATITEATDIIAKVRNGGDSALRELSARLDGVRPEQFEVSQQEIDAALGTLHSADIAAIDQAIANVRRFHEAQRPTDIRVDTMPGVRCERISQPLDSVGLYVPAGTAPLPSAAIMLAVPATIAGCPVRVMCTPPQPDGTVSAAIVAAAVRAGVTRIFKIGGAQAIAAMAFGTESVPRIAKLFGPGNSWVTAAKTIVARDSNGPAIDMPAGPSEVLVIADASANPEFVSADLLSQAEHGVDSQVLLLTTEDSIAQAVLARLGEQLSQLTRRDIANACLANSAIVLVESIEVAIAISNRYSPEHLILHVRDPRRYVADIRNAGSVFLGPWAPESVGDYCSGTNHVLPTNGCARSYSGLGVDQFMRHMTLQELTQDGLRLIAPTVMRLAGLEGLDAHANAVRFRLEALGRREKAG